MIGRSVRLKRELIEQSSLLNLLMPHHDSVPSRRLNQRISPSATADFFNQIGHFQTHAAQRSGALRFYPSIPTRLRPTHSFDHLVGNRKQIGRETETKKLTAFW